MTQSLINQQKTNCTNYCFVSLQSKVNKMSATGKNFLASGIGRETDGYRYLIFDAIFGRVKNTTNCWRREGNRLLRAKYKVAKQKSNFQVFVVSVGFTVVERFVVGTQNVLCSKRQIGRCPVEMQRSRLQKCVLPFIDIVIRLYLSVRIIMYLGRDQNVIHLQTRVVFNVYNYSYKVMCLGASWCVVANTYTRVPFNRI